MIPERETHPCCVDDLTYHYNDQRVLYRITCNVCGRVWFLTIRRDERGSVGIWGASPHPQSLVPTWRERFPIDEEAAERRRAEEGRARQDRLNSLDRIARDRAEMLSETEDAFQRWQRSGGGVKWSFRKALESMPEKIINIPLTPRPVFAKLEDRRTRHSQQAPR